MRTVYFTGVKVPRIYRKKEKLCFLNKYFAYF